MNKTIKLLDFNGDKKAKSWKSNEEKKKFKLIEKFEINLFLFINEIFHYIQ